MIDSKKLLTDCQTLLRKLEDDLRQRCRELPDIDATVRAEYARAREAERTAAAYEVWRDEFLTQVGVMWILAGVFIRFLEDNRLIDTPLVAGTGERLQLARDEHTLYFRAHPRESDREYWLHLFQQVEKLPGMVELFDRQHNPLWKLGPSGDGATLLLNFWQRIDPASGRLIHDFTDKTWNTRFLGDLYQDLSESARKKYALLQTPKFVEDFILDRTLTPAIQTFGLAGVRLLDPTCGSGHFLLGAFERMIRQWQRTEPVTNVRVLAQRTLDAVSGVDVNPFAIAIARFRLLTAALRECDIHRLSDAPAFHTHLAVGDSLLHGKRFGVIREVQKGFFDVDDPLKHVYETEDADALREILGRQYQVVVGNPPYITPKDAALNQAYRQRFGSCHMKYSLAVPFMERFFDLGLSLPSSNPQPPAPGFIGMITANSFMKREFGKKLIETFIPGWDLTHVIDTSGAYIPGHGTPTVILFGRNQRPVTKTIRTVMGIKGEPSTPADAAQGLV